METLDDISYLVRSENRVKVLRTIVEGSRSRDALREATGIPRQTAARILTELESRGWAHTRAGECRATSGDPLSAVRQAAERIQDAAEIRLLAESRDAVAPGTLAPIDARRLRGVDLA